MEDKWLTRKERRALRSFLRLQKRNEKRRLEALSKELGTGYAKVPLTQKTLKPYEDVDLEIMTNIRHKR